MSQILLYHNLHVNNTFASFFRALADGFSTEWFDRTKDVVISTYEKTVERERQRRRNASENYSPSFPFITLNPELEFEPEEIAGRFLYQYPAFAQGLNRLQWSPRIYEDDNMNLSLGYTRYRGSIELIIWASSIYELFDYRVRIFQFFGGLDRIFQPVFEGFFILPDEIYLYEYQNQYTGEKYNIDWDKSLAEVMLIRNINSNKLVYPFINKPFLKLTSVSDGADRYGGTSEDSISEHRIICSLEYEMWVPTIVVLSAEFLPTPCKYFRVDLGIGYQYSNITKVFDSIVTIPKHQIVTYVESEDSTALTVTNMIWDTSYTYELTVDDINQLKANSNVMIDLPKNISDCIYIKILTKFGSLVEDFHWKLKSPSKIELIAYGAPDFKDNDLVVIEIYKDD